VAASGRPAGLTGGGPSATLETISRSGINSSTFFGRLAAGESFEQAAARLPGDVELAFDLLQHGIGSP
jgi:hypothetical protein